jgi:YHS domain-containing protein
VASSEEGSEYVYYFCGEACFDKWQQGQNEAGKPGQ